MGLENVSKIMILKPLSTHYGSKYKQFKCVDDTLSLDRPRTTVHSRYLGSKKPLTVD